MAEFRQSRSGVGTTLRAAVPPPALSGGPLPPPAPVPTVPHTAGAFVGPVPRGTHDTATATDGEGG